MRWWQFFHVNYFFTAMVGVSQEIWCSNRETGRFDEKLGDTSKKGERWQVWDHSFFHQSKFRHILQYKYIWLWGGGGGPPPPPTLLPLLAKQFFSTGIKGTTSIIAVYFEKMSLNFSTSSFPIQLNLLHPQSSLLLFVLDPSPPLPWGFSSLANYFYRFLNTLTAI